MPELPLIPYRAGEYFHYTLSWTALSASGTFRNSRYFVTRTRIGQGVIFHPL
jgi:hypothetical protein